MGPRHAACHRCGWKQPLNKVSGGDRQRLGTGRRYHWLCDGCWADLLLVGVQERTLRSREDHSPDPSGEKFPIGRMTPAVSSFRKPPPVGVRTADVDGRQQTTASV